MIEPNIVRLPSQNDSPDVHVAALGNPFHGPEDRYPVLLLDRVRFEHVAAHVVSGEKLVALLSPEEIDDLALDMARASAHANSSKVKCFRYYRELDITGSTKDRSFGQPLVRLCPRSRLPAENPCSANTRSVPAATVTTRAIAKKVTRAPD